MLKYSRGLKMRWMMKLRPISIVKGSRRIVLMVVRVRE